MQNVALLELAKEKGESWRLLKKSSKGMKRGASIVEGLTPLSKSKECDNENKYL